jgi:hypothetical protein
MARLLGSDYAQAAVNQQVLHRLLQEINSDDELINLTSIIQENLEKIINSIVCRKFCRVCNFTLKSNIDLYSMTTELIRVVLLIRKVAGIKPA